MARSDLLSGGVKIGNDDGSVLISVIKGEQLHLEITLDWLTSLDTYDIHVRLMECLSEDGKALPELKVGGVSRLLTIANGYIIDADPTDNKFVMVLPYDLAAGMSPQPTPANPVFMFIDMEVGSAGTGDATNPVGQSATPTSQIWKPFRGLVQIDFSTTEL